MDILLIILSFICLVIGLLGCIIPMLPGPPISYIGLLLLHFTQQVDFTPSQLILWLVVVIIIQVLDYIIPMLGVKKFGGTKYGNWGCILGTIAGIFLCAPIGIIIGPFIGAVLGEIYAGNNSKQALKAGMGAFLGFLLGTLAKVIVCGWFFTYFIGALIKPIP